MFPGELKEASCKRAIVLRALIRPDKSDSTRVLNGARFELSPDGDLNYFRAN